MLTEIQHFDWELDVAFDVLDAAVHRCMSQMVNGFVDFIREEPTRATVVYILSQYQIGKFGKIRIDKLGAEKSIISFFEIRNPFADKLKHYDDFIDSLLFKLNQENIFFKGQDNQQKNLSVGKDVNDSIIINGDNNTINLQEKE